MATRRKRTDETTAHDPLPEPHVEMEHNGAHEEEGGGTKVKTTTRRQTNGRSTRTKKTEQTITVPDTPEAAAVVTVVAPGKDKEAELDAMRTVTEMLQTQQQRSDQLWALLKESQEQMRQLRQALDAAGAEIRSLRQKADESSEKVFERYQTFNSDLLADLHKNHDDFKLLRQQVDQLSQGLSGLRDQNQSFVEVVRRPLAEDESFQLLRQEVEQLNQGLNGLQDQHQSFVEIVRRPLAEDESFQLLRQEVQQLNQGLSGLRDQHLGFLEGFKQQPAVADDDNPTLEEITHTRQELDLVRKEVRDIGEEVALFRQQTDEAREKSLEQKSRLERMLEAIQKELENSRDVHVRWEEGQTQNRTAHEALRNELHTVASRLQTLRMPPPPTLTGKTLVVKVEQVVPEYAPAPASGEVRTEQVTEEAVASREVEPPSVPLPDPFSLEGPQRMRLGLMVNTSGAVIQVLPDSPAARAGVLVGDVITEINGRHVDNALQLPEIVAEAEAADEIHLKVSRNGATDDLKVPLGAAPAVPSGEGV